MLTFDEQLQREIDADAVAASEKLKAYSEAAAAGSIDELPRSKLILGRLFTAVRESIEYEQGKPSKGAAGPLRDWLKLLDPGVAAVISLREVLGKLQKLRYGECATFQHLTTSIGRALETEVMTAKAYKVNAVYVDRALGNIKKKGTTSETHIRRTMRKVYHNVLQMNDDEGLGSADIMKFGKFGLQACMDAGLVELVRDTGAKGHLPHYVLHKDIADFLNPDKYDVNLVTAKNRLTMLAPPLPWTGPGEGGYYSPRRQIVHPLISTHAGNLRRSIRKDYRKALRLEAMPEVYSAVNYLQAQPFEIMDDMFEIVDRVWKAGGGVLGVPRPSLGDKPECPMPLEWKKADATEQELQQFTTWKRACVRHYTAVNKNNSHILECTTFLKTARPMKGQEVFHPVFLDFRGRVYYRGTPNPQGTDISRAVLHFHKKKPLGPRGVFWLKVHIANSLGQDKGLFEDRVAYVDSVWEALCCDLSAPEDSPLYRKADNPFCAVSAVQELSRALATGRPEEYCTGIVVHMDATCSGLQHFSALLRDEVGGRYVNLIDTGVKADIYQRVADILKLQVQEDARSSDADLALCAMLWSNIEITRALAKKPVMTYVYGATFIGATDGVLDYLEDMGYKSELATNMRLAQYMARLLFTAIEQTVPAAAEAMRWLRALASEIKADAPVQWTTPLGFPVHLEYRHIEELRIRVRSCGLQYVVAYEHTDKTNIPRMRNAMAPNFIHSLDATHLLMTVNAMQSKGCNIVTIHDSFGTHPSDVDTLLQCTKQTFVDLYKDNTILEGILRTHNITKDLPSLGSLNLEDVKSSRVFFN